MTDEVAPDGSPVEIYRHLPVGLEADLIDAAIRPGSEILELGSGSGRVTRALVERGHRVTAVDNSAAMLAELADLANVEPIEADIETLDLNRHFSVVLLASHFINTPEPLGDRFVASAARHAATSGAVLIESYRQGIDWVESVGRRSEMGPVGITVTAATVDGDRLEAVVVYDLGERRWEQPFSARLLDESGLRAIVAAAGLAFDRWLDESQTWFRAVP
jgi:SAM-dependent methyltransferase